MAEQSSLVSLIAKAWRSTRSNPVVNLGLRTALGASPWRERVPDSVWKRIPAVGEFNVEVPGTAGFAYRAHGEPLGKTLFWKGIEGFEPGTARIFLELAKQSRCLFDVGAYSGYYTLLGLTVNPALEAHCFEPVVEIRSWLVRQLERNQLESRARIVGAAVSEQSAKAVNFYVGHSLAPGSSLVQDYGGGERSASQVNVTSLDDYVASANIQCVDLIKIDTEGAESSVLRGARKILETQRATVLCEILDPNPDHLGSIEQLLRDIGYRHGHITESGIVEQPRLLPDPMRRLRNFLLWASERPLPVAIGFR